MKIRKDRFWLVVELVPDLLEAHSARKFGSPCVKDTRVPTTTAGFSWEEKSWDEYCISEKQAFAAYCFEAGCEWHKNRKLRKMVSDGVDNGWRIHNLLVDKANKQPRQNGRFIKSGE